jgi:hypothetical protein
LASSWAEPREANKGGEAVVLGSATPPKRTRRRASFNRRHKQR